MHEYYISKNEFYWMAPKGARHAKKMSFQRERDLKALRRVWFIPDTRI